MEADFLGAVRALVRDSVGEGSHPVVVYSSAFPFMREMRQSNPAAVETLLDTLLEAVGTRTLLMPAFTGGFREGMVDLDSEPSTTGLLSEAFRHRPGVRRTRSAFFSFSVAGPDADEVLALAPNDAWGEGSVYEWMERRDACFLMFGTHPTHCSYLHRFEWLARDVVNYRFDKPFVGAAMQSGVRSALAETLYARRLDPPVVNDFTVLLPHLYQAGMRHTVLNGVSVAAYRAQAILHRIYPSLRQDPLLVVQNRQDYEVKP